MHPKVLALYLQVLASISPLIAIKVEFISDIKLLNNLALSYLRVFSLFYRNENPNSITSLSYSPAAILIHVM